MKKVHKSHVYNPVNFHKANILCSQHLASLNLLPHSPIPSLRQEKVLSWPQCQSIPFICVEIVYLCDHRSSTLCAQLSCVPYSAYEVHPCTAVVYLFSLLCQMLLYAYDLIYFHILLSMDKLSCLSLGFLWITLLWTFGWTEVFIARGYTPRSGIWVTGYVYFQF